MVEKSNSERMDELEVIIRGLVEQVERLKRNLDSLQSGNKNALSNDPLSPASIGARYSSVGDITLRYKTGEIVEGASPIPRHPQTPSGE